MPSYHTHLYETLHETMLQAQGWVEVGLEQAMHDDSCNLSRWESEAGGSSHAQGQPGLQSKSKLATLVTLVRPDLRKKSVHVHACMHLFYLFESQEH